MTWLVWAMAGAVMLPWLINHIIYGRKKHDNTT